MASYEDEDGMLSDSDYAYESDHDDEDDMDEVNGDVEEAPVAARPGTPQLEVVTVDIPQDTVQYQWTALCVRLAATYPECAYDLEDNLVVRFSVDDMVLTLSVPDTTDIKLLYPNAPPQIAWQGSHLVIDNYLLVIANHLLVPTSWNLCADLNSFVYHALRLMHDSPHADPKLADIDETIISVVKTCGASFRFNQDEELPSIGVTVEPKAKPGHSYLGRNERIAAAGSLAEMLNKPIKVIADAVDRLNESYARALLIIVRHILSAKISRLEVVQNEEYYRNLIRIVETFSLEIDVERLRGLLHGSVEKSSNDKVFFVESFQAHTFTSSVSRPNGKLVKRVFAEVDSLRDTVKDIECYVCVSEANIQLMKMLMIPDYDTPYGGGYFEFDMLVPNDYPGVPPQVRFLTTGGGRVRFNPNLYECGKVCLSVLNTWADAQWSPASSTLSQVVLSIFSMVFIDHPYTNEPSFYNALETEHGKTQSEAYNTRVRQDCVQVAITEQLQNRLTPFKDIIQQHWQKQSQATIDAYRKFGLRIETDSPSKTQRKRVHAQATNESEA